MPRAAQAWLRLSRIGHSLAAVFAGLRADRRGGTAIIFAVSVPILALLTCGTVDLASLSSDHSAMQDVADAAALDAAKQLGVGTNAGIAARADQFTQTQLSDVGQRVPFTTATSIAPDNSSVTVTLNGHRDSFFANLLPPGGWDIHVQATASNLGQTPLCVLSSGTASQDDVRLANTAVVTANNCLVQSNSDISVAGSALLHAGTVQAVGTASGNITPSPQTGSPAIADPFASMNINPPLGLCTPLDLVYTLGVNILTPGVHCGNITVRNGATVLLLPGEHYFMSGQLQMQQNSVLTGSDVVLVFDNNSDFNFQDSAQINLSGRRSGTYAGFVIATTRQNTHTFAISSDSARQLLGTIYIPNAKLQVTGSGNQIADQSAWTVVVAKSVQLTGSPNLVINANYAGSNVPVPNGVGPTGGNKVKLER
jgi:Flp pilus assembly protein TadG